MLSIGADVSTMLGPEGWPYAGSVRETASGVAGTAGSIVVGVSWIPVVDSGRLVGTAVGRTLTDGLVGARGGALLVQATATSSKSIAANPITAANWFFMGVLL
jgi:hypothetical protein